MAKRFVWLAADFHRGSVDFDEETALKYVEWAKRRDCDIICMGDMMETAVPEHMPQTMWQQIENPDRQLEWLIETFRPLRRRIKAIVLGNHEYRIWKKTSICPMELFATALGIKDTYLGVGGDVMINAGGIDYSFAVFHGRSGAMNPRYELQKAQRIYPQHDVIAIAHNHQLFTEEEIIILPGGKRHIQQWVRCGSFLNYPDYAKASFHPVSRIGNPIIALRDDRKNASINISNFIGSEAHS